MSTRRRMGILAVVGAFAVAGLSADAPRQAKGSAPAARAEKPPAGRKPDLSKQFLPPAGAGKKWRLFWHDEFDGKKIDESKWEIIGDWKRRDGYWVKADSYLDGNGQLLLRTKKDGDRFTSGAMRTRGKFEHRFGYWECRCKFPTQEGHWPAFWLFSTSVGKIGNEGRDGTEIDIAEMPWRKDQVQHALHWDGYGRHHRSAGKKSEVKSVSKGFHTFGLHWRPDEYVFYMDGQETWRTAAGGVRRSCGLRLSPQGARPAAREGGLPRRVPAPEAVIAKAPSSVLVRSGVDESGTPAGGAVRPLAEQATQATDAGLTHPGVGIMMITSAHNWEERTMGQKCPLCGQTLPKGISARELENRIRKLASPLLADEEKRLRKQFREEYQAQFKQREETVRRQALREAKASAKEEVSRLKQELTATRQETRRVNKEHREELREARKQAADKTEARFQRELAKMERRTDQQIDRARARAVKDAETRLARLQSQSEKERRRYLLDNDRLQRQVTQLSRQLEKATSQQRGDEGEMDLLAALRAAFPSDRIERVKKGVKGADIVHEVMSGPQKLGLIVYESKNVSTWQNAFVTRAKQFQKQYGTPYVTVVSRVLPRKQRGLCVVRDIPIVEPQMAVPLAGIIRDAIVELGRLRLSRKGRTAKAHKLFDYILSSEFETRFKRIADSVRDLKSQQQAEREWHERSWRNRENLHERIDACRREIKAEIETVTEGARRAPRLKIARTGA